MSQEIPSQLIASLHNAEGFDEKSFIAIHESGQQVVSIRFNPLKFHEDLHNESPANITNGQVPWSSSGYYLSNRPSFTLDPLFHAGLYYVQEASSMFLEEAIRQSCDLQQPLRVLDLCAAPGGKSTLIQSILSSESLLVSNEVIKARANILVENMTKWGAANVVVTNNEARDFQKMGEFFDVIVVDAPCSGSGLFRKDSAAIDEWSLSNVMMCRDRQQRILSEVMGALKPGGILVYSTCSFSLEEDEEICDWLLLNFALETEQLQLDQQWGIVQSLSKKRGAFGYRFYPDKIIGEGFFLAVFKKKGEGAPEKFVKPKQKQAAPTTLELETASQYIQNKANYTFIKWNEALLILPSGQTDAIFQMQATLYLKKAGVNLGTVIRNELIPNHELALSHVVTEDFPCINVELPVALDYLRRNDIKINTDARGWAIIRYKKTALGLVKILPNRINNYYPREWRILNM